MDKETEKIVMKYLLDNNINIVNGGIRTSNHSLINNITNVFGFNPLFKIGVEWIVYKVKDKIYKIQYDVNGRKVAYSGTDAKWEKVYDEKGNVVMFKNSSTNDGNYTWWKTYDDNNVLKHYRDTKGNEWDIVNGEKVINNG